MPKTLASNYSSYRHSFQRHMTTLFSIAFKEFTSGVHFFKKRMKRFELSTSTLARSRSTTELHPHCFFDFYQYRKPKKICQPCFAALISKLTIDTTAPPFLPISFLLRQAAQQTAYRRSHWLRKHYRNVPGA